MRRRGARQEGREKKLHSESWNIQVWMRPGGVPESETSQFVVDSAENFFFKCRVQDVAECDVGFCMLLLRDTK